MQPKKVINNIRHRHHSFGKERRLNWTKLVLDKAPNFPLAVELKDIDSAFNDWVNNDLAITFNGKSLPTFKLYSNQRINEYAQTWNHLDETGNLIMNFKTITRENNPQKGTNQGELYNIPGNRDYPMFIVPVLQENGLQAYDMYSMKQPYALDITYSVTVITNKYELLNEMNMLVNGKFKALTCYLFPNGHAMPMSLDSVEDESEYAIDDRKYYSQTYKIKLKAYIIKEEDYKVTHLESRLNIRLLDEPTKFKSKVEIEEFGAENMPLTINVYFKDCEKEINFTLDTDIDVNEIEVSNIYDFRVFVNGEYIEPENLLSLYNGDEIKIDIERDDEFADAKLSIKGVDPRNGVNLNADPESSLDEQPGEVIIDVES